MEYIEEGSKVVLTIKEFSEMQTEITRAKTEKEAANKREMQFREHLINATNKEPLIKRSLSLMEAVENRDRRIREYISLSEDYMRSVYTKIGSESQYTPENRTHLESMLKALNNF